MRDVNRSLILHQSSSMLRHHKINVLVRYS